jgi:tight adherence protein B
MDILPILAAITGASLALLMLAFALGGPSTAKAQSRRIAAVRERHGEDRLSPVDAKLRQIMASRETKVDLAFGRFLPNPAELSKRLHRTGKSWTVSQYGMASAGLLIVVAGLAFSQGLPLLLAAMLGLFAAAGLPHLVVGFTISRRVGTFNAKFADGIDLLVRGLRSGLPISETIAVVGQEVDGPVGEEFRSISDKMKIGRSMDTALQETADRLATPEFQFFCITIAIQRETGGNLAETLSNLSDVLRKRIQMKLKIRALSSEAKASAIIIGVLPFAVFYLMYGVNPGYMTGFFSDQRLIVAGLGGLVWMSLGAFIMYRMTQFEI